MGDAISVSGDCFLLAHDHFHTQQFIRASGAPLTFLRASLYTDNVPQCVSGDNILCLSRRINPAAIDRTRDLILGKLGMSPVG
jgi:hypothetical protein